MQLVITIGWSGSTKEIKKAGLLNSTSMRGSALLKHTLLTIKAKLVTCTNVK